MTHGCEAGGAGASPASDVCLCWSGQDQYYIASGDGPDRFIHKDLASFLRRELDACLQRELIRLMELEQNDAACLEQGIKRIRRFREAANRVIDALARREDRHKRLWLKKKSVVDCFYCISLDRIPEGFYPEIAANDRQFKAWLELFAIDQIAGDAHGPACSSPLTVEFLRANPGLIVNTSLFPEDFTHRLLAGLPANLDESTTGVLVNSDNFHAISLLQARFAGAIKCVYIDPPYNTGGGRFVYKDAYRHSAWLSFLDTRLEPSFSLFSRDGALFVSIDDNEVGNLCGLVRKYAPEAELVTLIAAQLNPRGRTMDRYLAKSHEYVATFAVHDADGAVRPLPKDRAARAQYRHKDADGHYRPIELRNRNPVFNRSNRPNLFYPFYACSEDGSVSLEKTHRHSVEIFPRNLKGEDGCWTWSVTKAAENIATLHAREARTGHWRVFRKDPLKKSDGRLATTKAKSIWLDRALHNEKGKEILHDLFGAHVFDFPKAPALVARCAQIGMGERDWFADFFAGSGTSGHAILDLNRAGGDRRFLLVEIGPHFDRVLVPRLLKVAYSPDWKHGRPRRRNKHVSVLFKCLRLESYEDCLRGCGPNVPAAPLVRESFLAPFVAGIPSREAGQRQPFDLLETFNCLLGLRVERITAPEAFASSSAPGYTWWFRTVRGWKPQKPSAPDDGQREKILIIWRSLTGDSERDNRALSEWFSQAIPTDCRHYDTIYVNGPNDLPSQRREDEAWQVHLIEEHFPKLMWEGLE